VRRENGRLDVAMIQSLTRRGVVDDIVGGYGHVIVDECHHVPAVSFERVMREVTARYVLGLTATPHRRDGLHPLLELELGPVRFTVSPKQSVRSFVHRLVVRETEFSLADEAGRLPIQELYALLARDDRRNELIVRDVQDALAEGRSPLLLTERRDHLAHLAEQLRSDVPNMVVLRGGMRSKERREGMEAIAGIPEDEPRLILATGRFVGEGFDDPRLDTLFLVLPFAWKGTLVQYAGRLHRRFHGKAEVRIVDYVDARVPMLARMFEKRLRGYRAMGYSTDDTGAFLRLG
jgi:superfamily II DNA or RNA helicase